MKTANQLTFTTYEASLKLKPNDPTKIIFDNIDWSFVHHLVNSKYSPHGAEGYDPVSLFKAQLLIYLGEVSSDRKLASALPPEASIYYSLSESELISCFHKIPSATWLVLSCSWR